MSVLRSHCKLRFYSEPAVKLPSSSMRCSRKTVMRHCELDESDATEPKSNLYE